MVGRESRYDVEVCDGENNVITDFYAFGGANDAAQAQKSGLPDRTQQIKDYAAALSPPSR